jgi:hypothetical protein
MRVAAITNHIVPGSSEDDAAGLDDAFALPHLNRSFKSRYFENPDLCNSRFVPSNYHRDDRTRVHVSHERREERLGAQVSIMLLQKFLASIHELQSDLHKSQHPRIVNTIFT